MAPTTHSIAALVLSVAINSAQGRLLGTSNPPREATSHDHDLEGNIQQLTPPSLNAHDFTLLLNNKDMDYSLLPATEHEDASVSDGFSYLGKTAEFNLKNLRNELPLDKDGNTGVAIRFTADGDLYVSNDEMMPLHSNEVHDMGEVPPSKGMVEDETDDDIESDKNNTDRDLFIIGPDDRTKVSNTTVWPYRIVGALISKPNAQGFRTLCTGTVISSTSILTAAHCVYDQSTGTEKAMEGFAPAVTMIAQNVSVPFGFWEYESATIYTEYTAINSTSTRSGDYDIAVVNLKKLNGFIGVGHVVGNAGIRQTDFDTPELQSSTITGYPADKPVLEMWTSADSLCTGSYERTNKLEYVVRHDCDTQQGTSGAALLDPEGYVHGVNWGGVTILNAFRMNLGNILRGSRYTDIMNWSERTSNSAQT